MEKNLNMYTNHIYLIKSLCCTPKTNNIINQLYFNLKIKKGILPMRAAYRKKWPEQVDSIYRRPQEVKDWREAYTAPHRTKSHQLSFRLTVGPQCRVQLPPPSTSSFVPINLLFPKEAWQWKNHKQQLETRKSRIMDEWRNWLCSSNKHMRVHNTHTHTSGFQEVRPNLGKGKSHKSEVLILDWTGPFNTWSKITRKKICRTFLDFGHEQGKWVRSAGLQR